MSESSSTTRRAAMARTVAATTPIAMHAVAQHMLDHTLPAPTTIDAPRVMLGERAVIVTIDQAHSTPWLDSMVVDDETIRPAEVAAGWEHVAYTGRIDSMIGEVALQIRTMRKSIQLRSVPDSAEVSA